MQLDKVLSLRADRIAKQGAFGNSFSHIDIPLSTREMFNILLFFLNRMKTDLNLSHCSYPKGPRLHLASLVYILYVNVLKTK